MRKLAFGLGTMLLLISSTIHAQQTTTTTTTTTAPIVPPFDTPGEGLGRSIFLPASSVPRPGTTRCCRA